MKAHSITEASRPDDICRAVKRPATPKRGSSPFGKAGMGNEAGKVLARVEVVFYKEILDHRGFPHRCELARVPHEAADRDEAIAGAIVEFEAAQHVGTWTIAADGYEVEIRTSAV